MAYLQSSRFIAPHRFVSGYIRTGLPQGWHYHGSGKLPKRAFSEGMDQRCAVIARLMVCTAVLAVEAAIGN